MENIFQFYGLDWAGMIFTFLSLWWLGDKRWFAFVVGALSSLCWAVFGIMTGSFPATFANIVFFFLNIRNLFKWRAEEGRASKIPEQK